MTFLIAAFIYLGVFNFAMQQDIAPIMFNEDPIDLITATLAGIGLLSLAAGFYVPKFIIRQGKKNSEQSMFGVPGTLVTAIIIRFSFFESIAIYGLILGLLSARWEIVLSFIGVAVIAMLLSFPTRERWEQSSKMD